MIYKIIYWAGMVLQLIIRAPFGMRTRTRRKTERRITPAENVLLALLTAANLLLPLIYSVTSWLAFANYALPAWLGWAGVVILACSLLVFARAHVDLQANWSPSLELYEEHALITSGIYSRIRHPMYASQLLWAVAQILLIQNWLAGPAGLILFFPFYFFRSREEERMMLERFGDRYGRYRDSTGGILPKL